ncbi:hypothetical protein [Paracidovorax oryzae]|uniref:hypothetical protein n=1 Tax=Paracidovorax oryzae TaxID=862720 RepID=UPI000307E559|nr:hypothetical protein [Paracidovorax oryzae]
MKLFTMLPARKTGELIARTADGTVYTFRGVPLSAEVEDEDHADELQASGFLTEEDFEAEHEFQKRAAQRAARLAAREGSKGNAGTFSPALGGGADDDDDTGADLKDAGTGLPLEGNTPPTGRVRRASKSDVVKG